MKKAQVSFEFILIFTIVFFTLAGFMYLMNRQMSEVSEREDYLLMDSLASSIKSEVLIASSVSDNYLRVFDLPLHIGGSKYNISLNGREIVITMGKRDNTLKESTTVLPIDVKGGFVETITENTTDHCITKSKQDGIRIARNQASLEPSRSRIALSDANKKFEVYVSLNCVKELISYRATIKYEPSKVRLVDYPSSHIIYMTKQAYPGSNSLFEDMITAYDYSTTYIYPYTDYFAIDPTRGVFTFGYVSSKCASGTGMVAVLNFEVISAGQANTTIEFDSSIGSKNLQMYDCNLNPVTDLPDSKVGATIEII